MAKTKNTVEMIRDIAARTLLKNSNLIKAQSKPKTKPANQQLSLPLWPEAVRGVPNAVLRGALFSINKIRTVTEDRELIATVEGVEIRYTGKRWNQVDLDLFETILQLAQEQKRNRVEVSAHSLLKKLGKGVSGQHHEELKNGIARLSSGSPEILWTAGKDKGKSISGAFISTSFRDDYSGRYIITLNPEMWKIYDYGYTLIDWNQRQSLGNNSLAKWLHSFYATHAQPYPYRVETIKILSGSTAGRLSTFRTMLRTALDQVVETGSIQSWEIDGNDLVKITKTPIKLPKLNK